MKNKIIEKIIHYILALQIIAIIAIGFELYNLVVVNGLDFLKGIFDIELSKYISIKRIRINFCYINNSLFYLSNIKI